MKYNFDEVINRKNTYCTQWDFTKDRFGYDDVIPFSISDTDFALPQTTINVISNHLNHKVFGYSRWNHNDFKSSIAKWFKQQFSYSINLDNLTYSPTVIYSLSELIRLKTTGKKVMTLDPAYGSFFDVIKENNLEHCSTKLYVDDDEYKINFNEMELKLKQCDILIFCNPHNPLGKAYTYDEIFKIINLCKKNNVFIISDEIHMDITFNVKHIPILKVAEQLNYQNNCCLITSATKTFNFPGLIFSYALIGDLKLKIQFEKSLKFKNGLSSCAILGLIATMDVYNNHQVFVAQLNEYLLNNVNYIQNFILKNDLKIAFTKHQSTYLMWFDATYYYKDFDKLLNLLYEKYKIGIMDGSIYNMKYHLRINIGCPKSKLEFCMNQLKLALNELGGTNNEK